MKKLTRSRDDKMLGGVCGGLAEHLGIDPLLVRIGAVVGTLIGFGSLIVAYAVMWVMVPREPDVVAATWSVATDEPTTASEPPPPSR